MTSGRPPARRRRRTDTRLLVAEFRRISPNDPRVEPEIPRAPEASSPRDSGVRERLPLVPRSKNGTDDGESH